jgi:hypothetical protein
LQQGIDRASRLKVAKFKQRAAAIENIDYATARGLRKDQILELASLRSDAVRHHRINGIGMDDSGCLLALR